MKRLLPLIVFFTLGLTNVFSQLSTKHYIPPITTGDNIGEQLIYISTPKNQDIAFTITQVGQPSSTIINGIVSNSTPYTFSTGSGSNTQLYQSSNNTSTITNNKGFIIEAEDVVYVSIRFNATNHSGALVSKGLSALGNDFKIGGFVYGGVNPPNNFLTFASIMATENNTSVTIDDLPPGIQIDQYSGTLPVTINLNEGESYIVSVSVNQGGNPNDLIGGSIQSDKPIVVNSGSATGSFANNPNGRDYGLDQIVDKSKVGSEYIFVRGLGLDAWENVLLIATEDNTNISVNGTSIGVTINNGEYHVIEGDSYNSDGNMYVSTTKPVFAFQGIGGLNNGNAPNQANQGLFFVPPLSCENQGNVDNIAFIDEIGTPVQGGGVSIVTNENAVVEVFQDGSSVTLPSPTVIEGYEVYRIENLTGNVTVTSSEELYCAYFNYNVNATSGSFYSGFPSAPEINFQNNVTTLGSCIPNLTLTSANVDLFDDLEWFFDDGSGGGFTSTGNVSDSITPNQPGNYKLIGTIACTGNTFESVVVPVSLCPDDYDNDAIIDNVDVDLDNDGILNIDESRGNVALNMNNITNPILSFSDGSTDSAFTTGSYSQSNPGGTANTFVGQNNGNFNSTLNPGALTENIYEMDFSDSVNFSFIQALGTTHNPINSEFFIIKILPVNKNITLIDPDDRLLVDTNFDGIYESGVTDISSTEIRFRYNPSPNGSTPFRFVANDITKVTFEHHSSNLTDTANFTGNFSLTSFNLDTDGDGIPDSLDLDSDNDGILDLYEGAGQIITLSGNDANNDGLDDIFNTITANQDTDTDGIPNALDLDSDNDGIYDVYEASLTTLDSNFDGIIDAANNGTVGTNGIFNGIETAIDSNVLNYTVWNIDADTLLNFIDLDSDGDDCDDVIEAGFTDFNSDGVLGDSPVTVDNNGMVTSGTDGYTNPNLNYSTSAPILLNTPFEDMRFCEASTSDIVIDSTADIFQWQISTDNGGSWNDIVANATYSNVNTTALRITNILTTYDGHQFRVRMNRAGNSCETISNSITLTVSPLPNIVPSVELKQCDNDTNARTDFNLYQAAELISPTNHTNETFVFYPTLTDANNDTNALTVAEAEVFENRTPTSDTVWVRTISSFNCYRVSEVVLTVSTTVVPNVTTRFFEECDDLLDEMGNNSSANDDTDGISSFDFSSVTAEIRGLFPASQQLTITYYRNEADALAENDPIDDPSNYRNIGYPNSQIIYVRVDSDLDNSCLGLSPYISLTVSGVPEAVTTSNPDIIECDDLDSGSSTDGLVARINLRDKVNDILGPTQTEANFAVTFHTSQADATDGTNAITNDTDYTNSTPNRETIYVRVENRVTACYNANTSFDIIVNNIPVIASSITAIEVCDVAVPVDGDTRNRIAHNIDLSQRDNEVLNGRDPNRYIVNYYKSTQDALNNINPLPRTGYSNDPANMTFPTNFVSDDPGIERLFVTISDNTIGCASIFATLDLIVYPEPNIPVSIAPYVDCDNTSDAAQDDTNGINGDIALVSMKDVILTNYSAAEQANFTVTFHENSADAQMGSNPINENQYENTNNNQIIYVRVVNNTTMCVYDDLSFQIRINPLPEFDFITPDVVCLNILPKRLEVTNPASGYTYEWKDENGTIISTDMFVDVSVGGNYSITATTTDGTMCSRMETIEVIESNIADIKEEDVTIIDNTVTTDNNSFSITINNENNNLGIGSYEYALTGEDVDDIIRNYQDDPVFENLKGGLYNILVRDKNGCGITSLFVSVIEFPQVLTPNGDLNNDTWNIKGVNSTLYPNSQVYIYSRFGKIVAQIPIDGLGWDGNYNGKPLPSDTYWFSVNLVPANNNKPVITKTGMFSLLRK